jgi:hypothetical protein
METRRPNSLVSAPGPKFAIGLIASLCAVLFPRLIAALTVREQSNLVFLTPEFAGVAAVFSGLVGVVVMILEWRVARRPRDTFMTTLGIPAILASALNANQGAQTLQQAAQTQEKLTQELGKAVGIPISGGPEEVPPEPPPQTGLLESLVETRVYAQTRQSEQQRQTPFNLGIRIIEPRYRIVLDRDDQEARARAKATQLAGRLAPAGRSAATTVHVEPSADGKSFLIVAGEPRPKSDALLEAIRLKNSYGLSPSLVAVTAVRK